jgi:hypothetical protein
MNTRKYPRTTLEAFGCRADTACAIERPASKESFYSIILAVLIGLFLALMLVNWAEEQPVNEPNPCGENGVLIDGKCYMKNGKKVNK